MCSARRNEPRPAARRGCERSLGTDGIGPGKPTMSRQLIAQ